METAEQLRDRLQAQFPAAEIAVVPNPGPAAQPSLLLGAAHARAVALFLRDDPALALDYCSNVTGVDWLQAGYLEAVYHLYSMARPQGGPVVIRMRTGNRSDQVTLPSLTPVWRSCEFQEREAFDLFGIRFAEHPDLRRILMWDEFVDHPMRKDYVAPDDDEWEPTAHREGLAKAKPLSAASPSGPAAEGTPS